MNYELRMLPAGRARKETQTAVHEFPELWSAAVETTISGPGV
jgi:hypothetical protein